MRRFRRILLIAIVLVTCVGCDQISKMAARDYLASISPRSYLGGVVRLEYTENAGAFLSFGSTLPSGPRFWVFTILTGIALVGLIVVILVEGRLSPAALTGLSFIAAGGMGNLIDRVLNHGAVIDFMNLGIGNLRTGIFNVADVSIMVGTGMLILLGFGRKRWRRIPS